MPERELAGQTSKALSSPSASLDAPGVAVISTVRRLPSSSTNTARSTRQERHRSQKRRWPGSLAKSRAGSATARVA